MLTGDSSRLDKLLLVLATFDGPSSLSRIKERAQGAGLKVKDSWSPSKVLSRSNGMAIRTPDGWELTDSGVQHLRNLGVSNISPATINAAASLRSELGKIPNEDTRAFVEEAITCLESRLFRSAVVMSWLAAVHVLQCVVVKNHLLDFNTEAKRIDARWKSAKTTDDLGRMREADFLERLDGISVIGKNTKTQLKVCLDLRNACGHPSSLRIGEGVVTHHMEVLLLNVFNRFSVSPS